MTVKIGGYEFEGPYDNPTKLDNDAGLYAILDRRGDTCALLDVGEAAMVKTKVQNHNRKSSWQLARQGTMSYAALYVPRETQDGRRRIEKKIRSQYDVACGSG